MLALTKPNKIIHEFFFLQKRFRAKSLLSESEYVNEKTHRFKCIWNQNEQNDIVFFGIVCVAGSHDIVK